MWQLSLFGLIGFLLFSCKTEVTKSAVPISITQIVPKVITEAVPHDTDDPAIWYNATDPASSLVLGTNKDMNGGLYTFDLAGKIIDSLTVKPLQYPNNVDIEYGFRLNDSTLIDIAVTVERPLSKVRIFSVPDMQPIDGGGIRVFAEVEKERANWPMGVSLYKPDGTETVQLIISRKTGPTDGTYLHQYAIEPKPNGQVGLRLLRAFGDFSGDPSEIEAIVVDDQQEVVFYSDEAFAIRKFDVHFDSENKELDHFGTEHFAEDREGLAIWPQSDTTGYLIASNQGKAGSFFVFDRFNDHNFITELQLSTTETDGIELESRPMGPAFPNGLFVAMSDDRTFHFYDLKDLRIWENL